MICMEISTEEVGRGGERDRQIEREGGRKREREERVRERERERDWRRDEKAHRRLKNLLYVNTKIICCACYGRTKFSEHVDVFKTFNNDYTFKNTL